MGIWVLPTANTLEVMDRVREAMPEIQAQLPAGMKVGIPYDSTEYIRDSIDEVLKTLSETLLIVIVVIFLFLGSVRSVIIPVVAIPISLIGAVFLMLAAGFTINLLTLLAIVLSVGLVVDDAIVMVENVERHLHEGKTPFQAAIDAARELVGPIIAMTITLAAVYTPVAIQGGLTGSLFREFAFTLAGAVLVSGVVALTLSPMMGSKLLRAGDTERGFAGFVNRRFERVRDALRADAVGDAQLPARRAHAVGDRRAADACRSTCSRRRSWRRPRTRASSSASSRPPRTRPSTRPSSSRTRSQESSGRSRRPTPPSRSSSPREASRAWSSSRGASARRAARSCRWRSSAAAGEDRGRARHPARRRPLCPAAAADFPVDFVIASTAEPEQLIEFGNQLVQKAFASGLFMFADTDLKFDQPQAEVVFDRDKLRSLGVDLAQAGRDLSTLLGGNYVNRFSIQGRSYKVIPQVKRSERLTAGSTDGHLRHGAGRQAGAALHLRHAATTTEPRELKRFQQLNAVRIQGAIPPGVSLDQALGFLEDEAREDPAARASPSTMPASRGSCASRAASSSAPSCSRRS